MTVGLLIAVAAGIVVPMLGGFGWLGYKIGKMDAKMVTSKDILTHQDRCPAYREVTSAVSTLPPALPPP